jgi:hypothetical protein
MLIGRESEIETDIKPRVKGRTPFIIQGQRGVGKTEHLKLAFSEFEGLKVFVSARQSFTQIVKNVAAAQGLEEKHTTDELEYKLFLNEPVALFVDDIENAATKLIHLLTSLNATWLIFMAGNGPFREELKRLLWGKEIVELKPLRRRERFELAQHCVKATNSQIAAHTIAHQSRGLPGRAWAIARGEVTEDAHSVEGEEINIAPVLLIVVAVIMITRVIGMGLGERDLYMLGGIGMGFGVFIRFFIMRAARK